MYAGKHLFIVEGELNVTGENGTGLLRAVLGQYLCELSRLTNVAFPSLSAKTEKFVKMLELPCFFFGVRMTCFHLLLNCVESILPVAS